MSGADGERRPTESSPILFRYTGTVIRFRSPTGRDAAEDHHRPGVAARLAAKSGSRAHVDQFDERRFPVTLHQRWNRPARQQFDALEFSKSQLVVIRTRLSPVRC